jgi:hypothetical protein
MKPTIRVQTRSISLFAALCLVTLPASARLWQLGPSGDQPADAPPAALAWQLDERPGEQPALIAPGHPLQPRLSAEPTTRLELQLPGGARVAVTALGLSSADTGRSLADGTGSLREMPEHVRVDGAWHGADDAFRLRAQSLKHDLVVHEEALGALGGGELHADWLIESDRELQLAGEAGQGIVLRDPAGVFLARIPAPVVADGGHAHAHAGAARWELTGSAPAWRLRMVVSRDWVDAGEREFPLYLDPSFSLQPADEMRTGFVDEFGQGLQGAIDSGSLEIIFSGGGPTNFFGRDCRGYAEFDTSPIPDSATVTSVRLQVWLSNHDNPGRDIIEDPPQPLEMEVKQLSLPPTSTPASLLWSEIGGLGEGPVYVNEIIPVTGDDWCAESYVFRDYDLGMQGISDLSARLALDYFAVGFTSFVGVDTGFDHIDYIGYPEDEAGGLLCDSRDLPGSRITLLVGTNEPATCDAGGPYLSDCPSDPIVLDGSGSADSDGDPLLYAWTTDCAGTISDADQVVATLALDPGCEQHCEVTLEVTEIGDGAMEPISITSCTAPVDAVDLTPPVLSAPAELVQECPPAVSEADWLAMASAVDACNAASVETVELSRELGCGPTYRATFEFTAVDDCGNRSESEVRSYEVVDTTPPVVDASGFSALCLWPPRHDGFPLGAASSRVSATDSCSEVTIEWLGCASDQPDEAREEGRPENGDGNFPNDCVVSDDGSEMTVRVERAGGDPDGDRKEGRNYGLLVRVSDECGNSVLVEGLANVPHDRKGGSGGQDDPCLRGNKRK